MVRKNLIYQRFNPPEHGKWRKKCSRCFSSFKLAFKAKILVIHVAQETSVWPQFGWEYKSVTKIWLWENVSDQNLAVNRRQFWSYWRLLTAKFWSLTFPCSQILDTDFCCQPNSGHTDVFSETCIRRISAFQADLKLEKASAAFYEPFSMFRG